MKRLLGILCSGFLLVTCNYKPLTAPDGGEVRLVSALGYHVEATQEYLDAGGTVTPLHGELADRWWTELMTDLQDAGYTSSVADPKNTRGMVTILLYQQQTDVGYIFRPGTKELVGSSYNVGVIRVAGTYPTAQWKNRPSSQPLKHEMLHHWCMYTKQGLCAQAGNSDENTNHVWLAPDGQNVWLFTWK